jgi:hypothetical protein
MHKTIYYIFMVFNFAAQDSMYLRKVAKGTQIMISPQRIIGQDLCRINKHILQILINISKPSIFKAHDKFVLHNFLIFSLGIHILTLEIHSLKGIMSFVTKKSVIRCFKRVYN